MTQTSSMMGSPYYMSPEQMTSAKSVDERSDIWALGIILHELLSGRVPYQGETIPEICVQVLQNPPPRLTELRPGAPADLERIIDRALAKNRDDRYQTVADFAADISAYATAPAIHSVERISKVLGVSAAARPSFTDLAYAAEVASSTATVESPVHPGRSTQESEGLSATTLGGATHEQAEYRPPTQSNRLPLFVGIFAVLLGAAAFVFLSGNDGDEAREQEPVVASDGPTDAPKTEMIEAPDDDDEPGDEAGDVDPPEEEPEEELDDDEPAEEEKATQPVTDVQTKPTPAVKPTPRPQPVATRPAPRPSAQPKPSPKPSTSSLYLDRK